MKISKEWTKEERLELINIITIRVNHLIRTNISNNDISNRTVIDRSKFLEIVETIEKISTWDSEFLNANYKSLELYCYLSPGFIKIE
jgi:hypothetical protein